MLVSLVLAAAAAMPLGVWPEEIGPPDAVVDGIEIYSVEPEDDFWIIAVQPLSPPVPATDEAAVGRTVALALKLGADAVLLLPELPEEAVPDDVDVPLAPGTRIAAVAFVSFLDTDPGEQVRSRRACGGYSPERPQAVAAAATDPSSRRAASMARRHSLEPITESTRKAAYSTVVGYSPLYR